MTTAKVGLMRYRLALGSSKMSNNRRASRDASYTRYSGSASVAGIELLLSDSAIACAKTFEFAQLPRR